MKGKSFFVATCSVIIFVFCISSLSLAADLWPKKDQQLCWYAYQDDLDLDDLTDLPEPNGFVRLWVMHSGKNQALVHGSNTEPYYADPPEGTQLTNGNAIVYPDNIVMHLSSSGPSVIVLGDEVRGWLGTINLDRDTLNGHFEGVGIKWDVNEAPLGKFSYDDIQTLIYAPNCKP